VLYTLRRDADALILGHRCRNGAQRARRGKRIWRSPLGHHGLLGRARDSTATRKGRRQGKRRRPVRLLRDVRKYANLLLLVAGRNRRSFDHTMVRAVLRCGLRGPLSARSMMEGERRDDGGIAAKSEKESANHLRHSSQECCGSATAHEESHRTARKLAVDDLWAFTGRNVQVDDSPNAPDWSRTCRRCRALAFARVQDGLSVCGRSDARLCRKSDG